MTAASMKCGASDVQWRQLVNNWKTVRQGASRRRPFLTRNAQARYSHWVTDKSAILRLTSTDRLQPYSSLIAITNPLLLVAIKRYADKSNVASFQGHSIEDTFHCIKKIHGRVSSIQKKTANSNHSLFLSIIARLFLKTQMLLEKYAHARVMRPTAYRRTAYKPYSNRTFVFLN